MKNILAFLTKKISPNLRQIYWFFSWKTSVYIHVGYFCIILETNHQTDKCLNFTFLQNIMERERI